MKKFKFNLDSLHRYRSSIEEVSMKEFSSELRSFHEKRQGVLRLREERERLATEIDHIKESGDSRLELALYATYIADLKEYIKEKEALLEACKKELEIKRLALIEVMKERKVLDVMKDKSFEEFNRQSKRIEQKILDDIGGARFFFGGDKDEE
ncbi:MAG: flagellar export protein FliJ [Thermodesulfobacteriota bacterium]